jgi:single-strand selective monofunctional uracil DNA glycosylase
VTATLRIKPGTSLNNNKSPSAALLATARTLSEACDALRFAEPVTHVYNPLAYAWAPFEQYIQRFGGNAKRVVFMGMNPGPFGMMQTGVPFGEVAAVRDWMGISSAIVVPKTEHPKRRIEGFACQRSEVSGRRVWGWAAERFGTAEQFFAENFVLNYCPLVFLESSGRNFTPDKLPASEARALEAVCDAHLAVNLRTLSPQWAVGIGAFAAKRLQTVINANSLSDRVRVAQILHPSPASPLANRGWAPAAEKGLLEQGVFDWAT